VHPHLLPAPSSADGSFWYVFEHLIATELADPSTYASMSPDQHIVYALGMLRQEVTSGGFEAYFRDQGGDTALDAQAAAVLVGHAWQVLISTACKRVGTPYPAEQPARGQAVDALVEADPDVFRDLDSIFSDLEEDQPVDQVLDEYVWANHEAFFG
jgi:hypothetical protein